MSMKEVIPHYKVVLLGEGRVGKTSILLRFVEDSYVEGCPSTTSASYLEKHVIVDEHQTTSRREANLSIWDTAGQERFHSLGPIYYRDAKGAVLVYDITDASTFDRVKSWTKELRKMVGDKTKVRRQQISSALPSPFTYTYLPTLPTPHTSRTRASHKYLEHVMP